MTDPAFGDWLTIPDDQAKWALVSRLKGKSEIDGGGSLHVSEVHVHDDDGTVYRFYRAISDGSGITVDDEIQRLHPKVQWTDDTPS